MKNIIALILALVVISNADTYKLSIDKQGGQGTATVVSDSTLKYVHDGSVVPTNVPWVLDSIQVHAIDAANNVGNPAYIFVKITPVNDHAPEVKSDTITVQEGGTVTWKPTVIDADN